MKPTTEVERRWASLSMMTASGFAGLGYQIIWTEQCSLWLGHESAGVIAVLAAFFGGLALGGLVLGERIERSVRPLRWYVGCEWLIAAWSLLLLRVGAPFSGWLLGVIGVQPSPAWHWFVVFAACFALFLPATAAMGATLPAMERLVARAAGDGRSLAALYAANTFGAVLGVLASAFWLIPALGLARSAALCVALNLSCGALALSVLPKTVALSERPGPSAAATARGVLLRLAGSGFLGIGYEVLAVRVLSQVTENTVYTFALLLAVYLVGTAAGAAAYQRFLESRPERAELGDRLFAALAAACLAGTATLYAAERMRAWASETLGGDLLAAIAAEALLALCAFGLPTIVMGALFCHLSRSASALGLGFGRVLGANTLAAALAPAFFGVLALPAFGAKAGLLAIVAGYLGLVHRRAWGAPFFWLTAAAALSLTLFGPALTFIDIPEGGRLVSYQEGVMAAVSVVEDASGVARLRINDRQQEGSSATRRVDARQAWLPLLLHPAPNRALFLGLGTGVTSSSAAEDPTLSVDVVELLPEVIAASTHFKTESHEGSAGSRFRVLAADARRYVRVSSQKYDVIVSDNFHPARSGSGALYTVEHFQAVRARLREAGLFCQWLPLHQLDLASLRSIVRAFLNVYPRAFAVLASNSLETPVLGLIARADDGRFDVAALRARLSQSAKPSLLLELGLDDEFSVLGGSIAGPAALARFAQSAPANTDDRPIVMYSAPRITYAADSSPRERLMTLLGELSLDPTELLSSPRDADFSARIAAYWTARDRFIEAGRDVHASARVEEMLARVREPLLSVLRISPDFRPAYDPLLAMSQALARTDVVAARTLLGELSRLQPARSEASQILARLDAAPASAALVRH
ncbi:MAG TPA: fused MFS/spermidine synthase [Polyangiaceae bacterium]|nr:fused MFS/spermidine synthase [Polyangiaceae bacterium]